MASLDILIDYIKLINDEIKSNPNYFKIILNRHCKLIEKINLLNEAVYEISFIQMIITTIDLLLIFVFIRKETEQITGYIVCYCGMLQIFPLCVFGEMIKIKSEKLSETFYEVNWYDLNLKDQDILAYSENDSTAAFRRWNILKAAVSYCAILYTFSK
ncbi:hypothetical protein DMENIID0001_154400 [Sergentomyia squamirostris]